MPKIIFSFLVLCSSYLFVADGARNNGLAGGLAEIPRRLPRKIEHDYQMNLFSEVVRRVYGITAEEASRRLEEQRFDANHHFILERLEGQLLAQSGNCTKLKNYLEARPLLARKELVVLLAYAEGRMCHQPFILFRPEVSTEDRQESASLISERMLQEMRERMRGRVRERVR